MNHPVQPTNLTTRPASYGLTLSGAGGSQGVHCSVYRNDVLLTTVRERTAASAVTAARRAVRIARQCYHRKGSTWQATERGAS